MGKLKAMETETVVEQKPKTLRQVLLEFYGPKSQAMIRGKETLALLEMRLMICEAVVREYATSEVYHILNVDTAMKLVFPGIVSKSSSGCGNCARDNVNRLKAQVPILQKDIAVAKGIEAPELVSQKSPDTINEPPVGDGAIAGMYTFAVVRNADGVPVVHAGQAMNGASTGYQRLFSLVEGRPIDAALDAVFPMIQQAHRAWKTMMLEPIDDPQEQPKPAQQAATIAQSEPSKPPKGIKVGSVLTNGEVEVKVLEVCEGYFLTDEGTKIEFSKIGVEWSKLPALSK